VLLVLGMSPWDDDDHRHRQVGIVRILEGETFVVPEDRILTIRTIGSVEADPNVSGPAIVKINGQRVFGGRTAPRTELLVGLAAKEGDTVIVEDLVPNPNQTSVLLGFLAKD